MTLTASMGFLDADVGSSSSDLKWLIVIEGDSATPPSIEVRRTIDVGGAERVPDRRRGRIRLQEMNEGGANGFTANGGVLELKLTGTPTLRAGRQHWEVLFSSPHGMNKTFFEVHGKERATDSLTLLTQIVATSRVPAALNSSSVIVQAMKLDPIPRLSAGLTRANTPPMPPSYRTLTPGPGDAAKVADKQPGSLRALLYRLFVLLDSPGTLDPVWDQQTLNPTTKVLSKARFASDPVAATNELWARQVSEMLSFARYGGPVARYGAGRDEDYISAGIATTDNPRYGLAFACQHLATFGVVSRGNTSGNIADQVAAGAHGAGNAVKMGATWFSADETDPQPVVPSNGDPNVLGEGPQNVDITHAVEKVPDYGPGSVHLFSNRHARAALNDPVGRKRYEELNRHFAERVIDNGTQSVLVDTLDDRGRTVLKELTVHVAIPKRLHTTFLVRQSDLLLRDNQDNPHSGFNIRVRRNPADRTKNRVQFLDTGGFGVTGRGTQVDLLGARAGFHTGIYDGPGATNIGSPTHPSRGFGVFPPLTAATAPALQTKVETILQRARPLGFARLVLFDRELKDRPENRFSIKKQFEAGAILYASPLLTMYLPDTATDSERSNYAISRFIWSLRQMPGRDRVEAHWYIYHPLWALAQAMISAPRDSTAVKLAKSVSGDAPHRTLKRNTEPIGRIETTTDGRMLLGGKIAKEEGVSAFNRILEHELVPMDRAHFAAGMPADTLPPYFTPSP